MLENNPVETLAQFVRFGRNAMDYSQMDLSLASGVSKRSIWLIENGHKTKRNLPRIPTIVRLARACNCEPMDWLNAVGIPFNQQQIEGVYKRINKVAQNPEGETTSDPTLKVLNDLLKLSQEEQERVFRLWKAWSVEGE